MVSIPHLDPDTDNLTQEQLAERIARAGWCRGKDPEQWFPSEPGSEIGRRAYEAQARSACGPCPVVGECLALALRIEGRRNVQAHGIWGGTAPWQRHRLQRSLQHRARAMAIRAEARR